MSGMTGGTVTCIRAPRAQALGLFLLSFSWGVCPGVPTDNGPFLLGIAVLTCCGSSRDWHTTRAGNLHFACLDIWLDWI